MRRTKGRARPAMSELPPFLLYRLVPGLRLYHRGGAARKKRAPKEAARKDLALGAWICVLLSHPAHGSDPAQQPDGKMDENTADIAALGHILPDRRYAGDIIVIYLLARFK